MKIKYIRKCPNCNTDIFYGTKRHCQYAQQSKLLCRSCGIGLAYKNNPNIITRRSDTRRKNGWNKNPDLTKIKQSTNIKKNKNIRRIGVLNGMYNKHHSEETKKKIRLHLIKRIQDNKYNGKQFYPVYNRNSIPILEQKAKELGITDLQHAENGGEFYIKELGYWVDGFSKEKNIVIEYYEKYHHNLKQKQKDKLREKEIIKFLNCEFIIIIE